MSPWQTTSSDDHDFLLFFPPWPWSQQKIIENLCKHHFSDIYLFDAKLPVYVPCFSGPFVRDDCLMWMSKWFWQMMQWLSPKPQWIPDAFPAATGWLVFSFFFGGWIYRRLLGIESHLSVECPDTRVHLKRSKVLEGWYPVGEISRKICA